MSGCRKPRCNETKGDCSRRLSCEALESRQMLSVNAGGLPALEAPSQQDTVPAIVQSVVDNSLGARDQALAISAVHLLIDGQEVTLNSLDQILEMEVGSSLQIVGIDYRLHGEDVVDGKIAFEGYLNKLKGSNVKTDYTDGRFGGHEQAGELPFGSASHGGLNDAWTMEAGDESITLVMVRYGADEVAVEDRITIRTQVGTPDFVMHPEILVKGSNKGIVAGKTVKLYGAWGNVGEGTYRNYMEVDIYHESDPSKIVWSGAISDVTSAGDYDKGQFLNKVDRDGFSKKWIPELGGTYTLKFYVDPEQTWNESNEDNNVGYAKLEVQDLRQVDRGKDASRGQGTNHHSVVDSPATLEILAAANAFRAEATKANPLASQQVEQPADQAGEEDHATYEFAFANAQDAQAHPSTTQATGRLANEKSATGGDDVSDDQWLDAIDKAFSNSEV